MGRILCTHAASIGKIAHGWLPLYAPGDMHAPPEEQQIFAGTLEALPLGMAWCVACVLCRLWPCLVERGIVQPVPADRLLLLHNSIPSY